MKTEKQIAAAAAAFAERWQGRGYERGAAAGIGRRGTVAAVALPDTRQRLRRGAEHLGGVWVMWLQYCSKAICNASSCSSINDYGSRVVMQGAHKFGDVQDYTDGFSLILKCFCIFATSKTNGCWTK